MAVAGGLSFGYPPASVRDVDFSRELREGVLAGDITLSVRLWKRPQVKQGGRYRVSPGLIEVDAIELVPFAAITAADVRRAGESDHDVPAARTSRHRRPDTTRRVGAPGDGGSASRTFRRARSTSLSRAGASPRSMASVRCSAAMLSYSMASRRTASSPTATARSHRIGCLPR